ncbi:MAG: flagellar biosynthesis anti-sigma factor FlgM [Thermodesulfobacteriota bacterium]
MKIRGKKPGVEANRGVSGPHADFKAESTGGAANTRPGDTVFISPRARKLYSIKSMVDCAPDVRSEMVIRLKTAIENGDYIVDCEKIAAKMIEGALKDMV